MLANLKDVLADAKARKYAVGAFNGTTLESVRAIIAAAEELGCAVIMQHAQSHDNIIDMHEIAPLMLHYAKRASVPVAVHLDHGSSYERCVQAIRLGFTSVMYDASGKDFDTNVSQTAEIVKIAHAAGVSVEAELGHVFTSKVVVGEGTTADSADDYSNLDDIYTDPDMARRFVDATGVDCLAVAFGTVHGVYLTEPRLDLDRVSKIRDAAGVPLVMHGGSGVSDADYRVAIQNGICKINYYTYMNKAGGEAVKQYLTADHAALFFDAISLCATSAMKADILRAMRVFAGK